MENCAEEHSILIKNYCRAHFKTIYFMVEEEKQRKMELSMKEGLKKVCRVDLADLLTS